MRLTVNYRTCLKTGQCYYLHPELFRQREDFYPAVLVERLDEGLRAAAEDAIDLCPSRSIRFIDTGEDDSPSQ